MHASGFDQNLPAVAVPRGRVAQRLKLASSGWALVFSWNSAFGIEGGAPGQDGFEVVHGLAARPPSGRMSPRASTRFMWSLRIGLSRTWCSAAAACDITRIGDDAAGRGDHRPRDRSGSPLPAHGARSGGRRSGRRGAWISLMLQPANSRSRGSSSTKRSQVLRPACRAQGRLCRRRAGRSAPPAGCAGAAAGVGAAGAEHLADRHAHAVQRGLARGSPSSSRSISHSGELRGHIAEKLGQRALQGAGNVEAAPGSRRCRRRIPRLARWQLGRRPPPGPAALRVMPRRERSAGPFAERHQERVLQLLRPARPLPPRPGDSPDLAI